MTAAIDLGGDFGLRARVMKLAPHPAAEVFPMLDAAKLRELAADIEQNGQADPIVLHPMDGSVLDGRNRYDAILLIPNRVPTFILWTGEVGTELDFVLSKNLHRRHLNESQRAMVAQRIAAYRSAAARKRKGARTDLGANLPEGERGNTADQVGEMLNVSGRTVKTAAQVARDGVPGLVQHVERGDLSVHAASEIARLPAEEQRKIIESCDPALIKQIATEQRKKRQREALTSSESNEHYTPPDIVERSRALMGSIDLDPSSCAKANEVVQATRIFTIDDNGLDHDWPGNVFMNPPGGRREEDHQSNLSLWTTHLREQYASAKTAQAIAVIFRVDLSTTWFRPLWKFALCFPWDRLEFLDQNLQPQKAPTHCNALVYMGRDIDRFVELFSPVGQCVLPGKKYARAVDRVG